jgi:hypothetical protein
LGDNSRHTQEILDQLAETRRRIEALRRRWDADHDDATVVRDLDELSADLAERPSIEALLFGAARLIERGEPAGRRLEKLSDHLHGYTVGWEDATGETGSL